MSKLSFKKMTTSLLNSLDALEEILSIICKCKSSEKKTNQLILDQFVCRHFSVKLKGIVHLNIIFSYMKVNKICNLDHPVY